MLWNIVEHDLQHVIFGAVTSIIFSLFQPFVNQALEDVHKLPKVGSCASSDAMRVNHLQHWETISQIWPSNLFHDVGHQLLHLPCFFSRLNEIL